MTNKLLPLRSVEVEVGKHLVLDAWKVSTDLLDDEDFVRAALVRAVEACDAILINLCVHKFSPYGVTATATLAESHIALHTWPEHGYLGADLFLCGSGNPKLAMDSLLESFQPGDFELRELTRGAAVAISAAQEEDGRVESA